jgi:hypothetical protein
VPRLTQLRNPPFFICGGIALIVTIAFFRLPETLVTQIEDRRIATGLVGNWTYRLLAVAAVLQAVYAGRALRTEKVRRFVPEERVDIAAFGPLYTSLARNAAIAVLLTFVYLLAAFFVTGGRASMWFFVALAVAQWAWYYRQLGKVAEWLGSQPRPLPEPPEWAALPPEPAAHVPPLARGLTIEDEGKEDTV